MASADDATAKLAKAEAAGEVSHAAAANIKRWLTDAPFASYRDRLVQDIDAGKWKTLDDAFYTVLEFGTGGRRGKMYPVGINVLNDRTIGESARGLADYISKTKGPDAPRSCVIARDTRHNSPEFAAVCARVLAAAGFKVYLFPEHRSTPLLSFAVRHLKCDGGIMITASHNPPADNGFKCYAATGGQVVPPEDSGIIACVKAASDREIPEKDLDEGIKDGSIVLVGKEVDNAYIKAVVGESVAKARGIGIVYTPLHGVGETNCAAAIAADGFDRLDVLASQRTPDGDFGNVPNHFANPEVPATMDLSIARARELGYDLVLASDPDADRIGVALPVTGNPAGDWTTLDGNQIGVLLTAFILEKMKAAGRLRPQDFLVTTLVSTQMTHALAKEYGIRVEDNLLVGFKWIGVQIDECGPEDFLFGFEESHGYLKGTHARDKDAAVASMLFAELVADLKARGKTVLQHLDELYRKAGYYAERQVNKVMEGREGVAQIKALMEALRSRPPEKVGGLKVVEVYDYKTHEVRKADGSKSPLPKPSGDLLIFHLDEPGTRFAARPSGTEPKIKFYLFARSEVGSDGLDDAIEAAQHRLDRMSSDLEQYIQHAVGGTPLGS
jgi:phosphoglucomutase/phosphomannomutase